MTKVVTYQLAHLSRAYVDLCDSCAGSYHTPLGPVSVGAHEGICYCNTVGHGHPDDWGRAEVDARWVDMDGSVSEEVYRICRSCLDAGSPGGPGYRAVDDD